MRCRRRPRSPLGDRSRVGRARLGRHGGGAERAGARGAGGRLGGLGAAGANGAAGGGAAAAAPGGEAQVRGARGRGPGARGSSTRGRRSGLGCVGLIRVLASRWRRRDEADPARAGAPRGFHNPLFYAADSAEAVRGARGRGCGTSLRLGSLTLRSRSCRPRSRTKGAPAAATSLIRCLAKGRRRPERPRDRPQPHPTGIAGPAGSPTLCWPRMGWPGPIKRFLAPAVSVDHPPSPPPNPPAPVPRPSVPAWSELGGPGRMVRGGPQSPCPLTPSHPWRSWVLPVGWGGPMFWPEKVLP